VIASIVSHTTHTGRLEAGLVADVEVLGLQPGQNVQDVDGSSSRYVEEVVETLDEGAVATDQRNEVVGVVRDEEA
jgi:hypothetical protein